MKRIPFYSTHRTMESAAMIKRFDINPNNPFLVQHQLAQTVEQMAKKTASKKIVLQSNITRWLVALLLLGVLGAVAFAFKDEIGERLRPGGDNHWDAPFADNQVVTYEEAQRLYREAVNDIKDKRTQSALEKLNRIEPYYHRLAPLIRYHQAEVYSQLGEEGKAQALLNQIVIDSPVRAVRMIAWYQLGKSAVRSGNSGLAQGSFQQIIRENDRSNLATGSHYYLGLMAAQSRQMDSAVAHWRTYLKDTTSGTFSIQAAQNIIKSGVALTSQDNRWVGITFAKAGRAKEALPYLQKAPFHDVWLDLARVHKKLNQTAQAKAVMERGLKTAVRSDNAQEAIQLYLSLVPAAQHDVVLKQWLGQPMAAGKDFILWQLQQQSPPAAAALYSRQLLDQYPDSDWGPETSWNLMWPNLKQGQTAGFLKQADWHLTHYPNSRSAPRVLFWKARTLAKQGQAETAQQLLRELVRKYPYQYYAFRAQELLAGQTFGWQTSADTPYPADPAAGRILGPGLARQLRDPQLEPMVAELITINVPSDVETILYTVDQKHTPAPIQSWIYLQQGNVPKALVNLREWLNEHRKTGRFVTEPAVYQVFYPLVYQPEVARYARANRLDPFLVQALMRQESYFNPRAVSSSNAMGLMQLLPSTAKEVAQWESLGDFNATRLFEPSINVRLGSRYLRYLHQQFNGNSALSVGAYNGGPGAMRRWRDSLPGYPDDLDWFIESIPTLQTRDYIKEVFSHYWNYRHWWSSPTTGSQSEA